MRIEAGQKNVLGFKSTLTSVWVCKEVSHKHFQMRSTLKTVVLWEYQIFENIGSKHSPNQIIASKLLAPYLFTLFLRTIFWTIERVSMSFYDLNFKSQIDKICITRLWSPDCILRHSYLLIRHVLDYVEVYTVKSCTTNFLRMWVLYGALLKEFLKGPI
jgi:hypothetical protein